MNKGAACQHKWQREWARGQSPPLAIKREKQSKEAIDINKVLTTIYLLALCCWAVIVMDLNSHTWLITFLLLKQPIWRFLHLFLVRKQPQLGGRNCSSTQHPAGSSLTVRRTVTSISCIWAWAKSASFLRAHTQPVQKKYIAQRPGALCWALALLWDSGLTRHLKHPASGNDSDALSHSE